MLRIAHFTDIHVTVDPGAIPLGDLFSKRLIGWLNLRLLGRQDVFVDAEEITACLVEDVLALAPDHVLFTGDFTGLSLRSEFDAARRVLAPLLESDIPGTALAGNHDVYVRSAEREGLCERLFAKWFRAPSAAGPRALLLGEDVALVAAHDVRACAFHDSSGLVGARQREALERTLTRPELAARTRILALHYGLRRANGSPDRYFHRLRDAEDVLALAERCGVALIVHGHLHRRFVHPAGTISPVAMANPGSLTALHGARAYHVYTISEAGIELSARRYDERQYRFVDWPDAPGSGMIVQ